jgi:hypothetical protein
MRLLVATLALVLACASCESGPSTPAAAPASISPQQAQAIVDATAKKYADVARLSIHAVQSGKEGMRIIASTVSGRVGDPSDPEDVKSVKTGESIVMREGRNLDYTVPVQDDTGRKTMAIGVTISGATSASEATLLERAKEVAMTRSVRPSGARSTARSTCGRDRLPPPAPPRDRRSSSLTIHSSTRTRSSSARTAR